MSPLSDRLAADTKKTPAALIFIKER